MLLLLLLQLWLLLTPLLLLPLLQLVLLLLLLLLLMLLLLILLLLPPLLLRLLLLLLLLLLRPLWQGATHCGRQPSTISVRSFFFLFSCLDKGRQNTPITLCQSPGKGRCTALTYPGGLISTI